MYCGRRFMQQLHGRYRHTNVKKNDVSHSCINISTRGKPPSKCESTATGSGVPSPASRDAGKACFLSGIGVPYADPCPHVYTRRLSRTRSGYLSRSPARKLSHTTAVVLHRGVDGNALPLLKNQARYANQTVRAFNHPKPFSSISSLWQRTLHPTQGASVHGAKFRAGLKKSKR